MKNSGKFTVANCVVNSHRNPSREPRTESPKVYRRHLETRSTITRLLISVCCSKAPVSFTGPLLNFLVVVVASLPRKIPLVSIVVLEQFRSLPRSSTSHPNVDLWSFGLPLSFSLSFISLFHSFSISRCYPLFFSFSLRICLFLLPPWFCWWGFFVVVVVLPFFICRSSCTHPYSAAATAAPPCLRRSRRFPPFVSLSRQPANPSARQPSEAASGQTG